MASRGRTTLSAILGEDGDHEEDNDVANIRERGSYFRRAQLGLFAVLYLINKGTRKTTYTVYVLYSLVNTLQLLYFCFNPKGNFSWPQQELPYVLPVLKIVTFSFIKDLGTTATVLSLVVCYIIITLSLLAAVWVGYSFSNSGVRQLWILPILRVSMGLATTTFYVPILTVLFTAFDCNVLSAFGANCNSSLYSVLVSVTSVIAILFISFTLLAVIVLYDRDPTGNTPVALVHGRVQGVSLSCRAVMTFTFAFLDQGKDHLATPLNKMVLALIVFGSSALMMGSTLYFLPYYCAMTNSLETAFISVFVWGSVCLLITQFNDDPSDSGVLYTFLISIPAIFFAGYMLAASRMSNLGASTREVDSVFTSEIILRYKYPPTLANWSDQALDDYKRLANGRFKRSGFLHVHLAHLLKELGENTILASRYIKKARTLNLSLDQSFVLFKHSLEASAGTGSKGGAISFIAVDHHFRQAEDCIVEALDGIIRFWKSHAQSHSTLENLFNDSSKVKRVAESARYHLDKLLELTNGSTRSMRLYAQFLKYVLNDKWKANELLEKALVTDDAQPDTLEDDLFDTKHNAILTLAGGESNIGELLQVSDRLCKAFGYTRRQLVGENVSMLMPPPFSHAHNMWLAKHLETAKNTVSRTRKVWGLHKEGFVMELDLQFKSGLDENDDLIFTGKLTPGHEHGEHFIVTTDEGRLLFASQRAWSQLIGKPAGKLGTSDSQIQLVVPELEDVDLSVVNARPKELEIRGTRYEVEITQLAYKNRQIDFRLIVFKQLDNFSDSDNASYLKYTDAHEFNEGMNVRSLAIARRASSTAEENQSDGCSAASSSTIDRERKMYLKLEKKVLRKSNYASGFVGRCLAFTILFIILAVAKNAALSAVYNAYEGSVSQESDAVSRAIIVAQLTVATQLYFLPQYNNSLASSEAAGLKAYLEETVETLADLHLRIEAGSPIDYQPVREYSRAQGVRTSIDGISFSDKTMFVAVRQFVNSIKHELETGTRGKCGGDCMYVLRNGPNSILEVCRESAVLYADQTVYVKNLASFVEIVYVSCHLALMGILTFRFLLSFAMTNWLRQESTARTLLNIPKQAVNDILKKAQSHLAEMKEDEDDVDGDDPFVYYDSAGKRCLPARRSDRNLNRSVEPSSITNESHQIQGQPVTEKKKVLIRPSENVNLEQRRRMNRVKSKSKVAPHNMRSTVRKKKKCAAFFEIFKRTVQLALPFLVPFGLYEVAQQVAAAMIPQVMPVKVELAAERAITAVWLWALVDSSGSFSRFNAFHNATNFTDQDFALLKQLYEEYKLSNHALLYGNHTLQVDGILGSALSTTSFNRLSNEHLMFENACFSVCEQYPELQVSIDIHFGLQATLEKAMQGFDGGFVQNNPGDGALLLHDGPYHGMGPYKAFLSSRVLAEALEMSLKFYSLDGGARLAESQRANLYLAVFYIVFLLYGGFRAYETHYRLTTKVKSTQFILFMVPVKVLLKMPELDKILNG